MVGAHKTEVSEFDGLGRRMPITFAAFTIGALSIVGLPPFAGLWSKWYLVLATIETDRLLLLGVLIVSSLLNIAYLLVIPMRAFFRGQTMARRASGGATSLPDCDGGDVGGLCRPVLLSRIFSTGWRE